MRTTWLAAALATAAAWPGAAAGQGADREEVRLVGRILAAVDVQHLDSATVATALASRAPAVRRLATLAIGQSRSRTLAPALRALTADPDSGVAANAAFALGLLVDSSGVSTLRSALGRAGPVAVESAWALGEIGEVARAAIVSDLGAPRAAHPAAPTVTAQLLYAAAKLRPVPVQAVVPFTASSDDRVRAAAAYALGRPRVAAGVRTLLGLVSDSIEDVRASVARGLARSAAGDSLGERARRALAPLVGDPRAAVRTVAVRSIATFGSASRAAVLAATRDPDPLVRIAAAESLGEVLVASPDSIWRAVWNTDSAFAYRRAVLVAAAREGMLVAERERWRGDADWRRRGAAAAASGAPAARADLGALRAAARDADARVRATAYERLAAALDSAPRSAVARSLLIDGLRDPDAIVRSVALAGLAERPLAAELPLIREAYERAAVDRDNDARLAALRYLAALWERDSAGFAAPGRRWLLALPAPRDPLERAAAGPLPVAPRWNASLLPPRSSAWYERVVEEIWRPALRNRLPQVVVRTERGEVALELFAADAPLTVMNFLSLVRAGVFDSTRFHRVVPAFVVQGGDPRGDGSGGPGYAIRDEHNRRRYDRGVLGMALSGPNTGGSQHFVTLTPQPHLDGHYTVFGRVVSGFDALDRIVQGDRLVSVRLP